MGARIRAHDWADTSLGSAAVWPEALRVAVSICLTTPLVAAVHWGPELRIIYNDAYAPALGDKHPWALGQPFARVWSEIWDVLGPQVDGVLATGVGFSTERQHLRMQRHGRAEDTWWIYSFAPIRQEDGAVAGIFVTALETTDGTLAERRQASERRLFENIFQSDGAPVVAWGTDYRLVAFNTAHSEAYARVYGIEQRIGDNLLEQFVPEQAVVLKGLMDRALAGESFIVREEFGDPSIERPSWQIAYNPLRDEDGRIIGAFHHARDITPEVRAASELASAQEALRQSQKMEAIGQLTGGVAHDFNNLLTVIRGSVDLLRRPGITAERRERYVDAIADTANRAARLTAQLLAFARRQALKPELFDIGASIDQVGVMVRTLTGSRIQVDVIAPRIPLFTVADRSQLDTAIVNLAINARDAMNGEGKLTIALGAVSNVPARRTHEDSAGDFVAIAVTDEGIGIAADQLDRIFEPFFTTKAAGHGTGLGLSQVIGFAKQSGGDITVESKPGVGTTFTLYLPRVDAEGRLAAEPVVDASGDGSGVCVLLVEDNAEVGTFAVSALQELGYDSVLALDGEAALVELRKDCARFHILFTDVVMPGIGGIELARQVRRDYPTLPITLTSGYSHVLAENGSYGFELLHKPYSIDQLSRVLRKAIAWHARGESATTVEAPGSVRP